MLRGADIAVQTSLGIVGGALFAEERRARVAALDPCSSPTSQVAGNLVHVEQVCGA